MSSPQPPAASPQPENYSRVALTRGGIETPNRDLGEQKGFRGQDNASCSYPVLSHEFPAHPDESFPPKKCRLAILVSGGGTTMQAIIDAIESGYLNAEIVACISSRREVKAPERARKHNIPVSIIRPRDFIDASSYDEALCAALHEAKPDLVVLAGYLSILGPITMTYFAGRIMNIHPSLLPAFGGKGFYGKYVHEKVIEYGCKVSGVTVMFVDNAVDTGPIILQRPVEVTDEDTVETLTAKVSQVEKELYPLAIKLYAEGQLKVEGRRVKVTEGGLCCEESSN